MTTEDEWEQHFRHAPTGYLTTSTDGVVDLVNDTFLRWSGLDRAAVTGTHLTQHMPVGDRILFATHCMPRLEMDGSVDEVALELVGGDGVRRAALLSAVRVPATAERAAVTRVVVFGAHARRRFERNLLSARQQAEESEARRAVVESELQHRVLHDPLTGLRNRTGLLTDLERMLAPGAPTSPALFFLDLDNFKSVNDSLGHDAGDEVLREVGRRLAAQLDGTSTLARLAGDEFVAAGPLPDRRHAATAAQGLLDAVTAPLVVQGLEVVLTVSIGLAFAHRPGDTPESLLRRADTAMYRAKANGRGGWQVQNLDDRDPAAGRLQRVGELRRGMAEDQLEVHYQPSVDLHTGHLDGVEALVRWRHPVRGLLGPAEFIEVAETSGLVRALGARVLDAAVGQLVRWRAEPSTGLAPRVAVNLSTRQLNDPGLVSMVASTLERHGLAPGRLTLEITETSLMDDPAGARGVLETLTRLGVRVAIDDFGTGYSSLVHLKQLPVHELKIDQLFVAGIAHDAGDRAIVAACVQLAHAVGSCAVAEGVETEEQRQILTELGCDVAQGYLFARPLDAASLVAWAQARPAE